MLCAKSVRNVAVASSSTLFIHCTSKKNRRSSVENRCYRVSVSSLFVNIKTVTFAFHSLSLSFSESAGLVWRSVRTSPFILCRFISRCRFLIHSADVMQCVHARIMNRAHTEYAHTQRETARPTTSRRKTYEREPILFFFL